MLKEFLEYLDLKWRPSPITAAVDDRIYAVVPTEDGPSLGALVVPPTKPTLQLASATGFVDACAANIDDFMIEGKTAVHVIDYQTVALVSLEADLFGRRHEWLRTTCREKNPFAFNTYMVPEEFLIRIQAGFLPTDNIVSLQKVASSLTNESSVGTQDDGMSQTVTVRQGAVTSASIPIPKRIELYAFRTFREIDPIASEFMVRLKGEPGKLPQIALFEVDGEAWKHDTQRLVAQWMKAELPKATVIA